MSVCGIHTHTRCTHTVVRSKALGLSEILSFSLVLIWGARLPVVRIERITGQYAKPRIIDQHEKLGVGRQVLSFGSIRFFSPCFHLVFIFLHRSLCPFSSIHVSPRTCLFASGDLDGRGDNVNGYVFLIVRTAMFTPISVSVSDLFPVHPHQQPRDRDEYLKFKNFTDTTGWILTTVLRTLNDCYCRLCKPMAMCVRLLLGLWCSH